MKTSVWAGTERSRMLLLQYDNVYSLAELDPVDGKLRARPWRGRWQRLMGRRRPLAHGFFERDGPMWFALYARDTTLRFRFDTLDIALDGTVTARVRDDDGERVFELVDRDVVMLDYRYPSRRSPIDKFDLTPFRDLVEEDLLELAAELSSDPQRRERVARNWSAGFRI